MNEHLWPLLRLKAASEDELMELYREVYLREYVRSPDGTEVELHDWTGRRVRFRASTFDHAFSESSDYRFASGIHDICFSRKRARRLLWIKEALTCSEGTIERRSQLRKDSRGRTRKRRILLVVEERYVVVTEEMDGTADLSFITAFPADRGYVEKIQRESTLLEIKKPQS